MTVLALVHSDAMIPQNPKTIANPETVAGMGVSAAGFLVGKIFCGLGRAGVVVGLATVRVLVGQLVCEVRDTWVFFRSEASQGVDE
jgi:hypothetical protein